MREPGLLPSRCDLPAHGMRLLGWGRWRHVHLLLSLLLARANVPAVHMHLWLGFPRWLRERGDVRLRLPRVPRRSDLSDL